MTARANLQAVRDVVAGAAEPGISDFGDDFDNRGGGERDDGSPPPAMPPGCPVTPLGTEGGVFYYLTALGELRALKARDHGNKDILAMFAPFDQLLDQDDYWPRKKAVKDENGDEYFITNGWHADKAAAQLMRVGADRGVWNALEKVRGRGAWSDEQGRLILHCGNMVLLGGRWERPGSHNGFVYPTAPPTPRPASKKAGTAVARAVLALLKTWHWARPSIDPMLALGWLGAAMQGGALKWRPVAWITGDKASGKSTLQELIGLLFDGGILQTTDATEAAIRQLLGYQSLPVAIDEAEAEEDDRKLQALVKLARQAASGGRIARGGQDHQGHEFVARSCFLFSSILVPSLNAADRSRLAVLELAALPAGARSPRLMAAKAGKLPAGELSHDQVALELREAGAQLRRRLADSWGQWPRILELYHDAMIDQGGHGGRSADQFATLLASAHMLLEDDPPSEEELALWGRRLSVDTLSEREDDQSEAQRCVHYLGSTLVQLAGHGQNRSVSEWVLQATGIDAAGKPKVDPEAGDKARAIEMLNKIGMGIHVGRARKEAAGSGGEPRPRPVPGRAYIVIANAHQGLARQFEQSHWKARSGGSGVWSQALGRVAGAVRGETQRISGQLTKCTLIPLEEMIGAPTDDEGGGTVMARAAVMAGAGFDDE